MSDPSEKDYSAIHGNFIPLQSPEGLFLIPPRHPRSPRRRSRSPQRRRQDQGVHLHLSLTDAQMDTLTSTLAKDEAAGLSRHDDSYGRRTRSPGRAQSPSRPSQSPTRFPHTTGRASTDTRTTDSSGGGRSPAWTQPYADQIAEEPGMTDASSSVYSMDDLARVLPHIHPLYVQKIASMSPGRERSPQSPEKTHEKTHEKMPEKTHEKTHEETREREHEREHEQNRERDDRPVRDTHYTQPVYSPLEPTFAARTGHKILVGHNGWLERTGQPDPGTPQPKAASSSLLDTLKRMAKATESRVRGSGDSTTPTKTSKTAKTAKTTPTRAAAARTLRISLDPREQSLLYCELEFLLTGALDAFLDAQFHAGRLDAAQYKRVVDAWQRQGRPRVVGFRFDLETQLDLVQRHAGAHALSGAPSFAFYGPRAADPVAAAALLASMKVNARALRIRTFCQPDSAVAKQLLDSQALLELLGAAEARQVQLAEVVQFFKIVLEREGAREQSSMGSRTGSREQSMGNRTRDTGFSRETDVLSRETVSTPPRLRPSRTAHSLEREHVATPPRAATQRGR